MAKRTKLERSQAAAALYAPDLSAEDGTRRFDYAAGWVDGHNAGTRDSQRRMARKFKQGLRLGFNT